MNEIPLSANEKRWQAESDAHTLAEAERIKEDKSRLDAAAEAAKRMAEEETERAKAMRKVAGRGSGNRSAGSAKKSKSTKRQPDSRGASGKFNVFRKL